jgi:hypothetical protein
MALTSQPFNHPQPAVVTADLSAKVDMARLTKAARGLKSGELDVLIEGRNESVVWGLVKSGQDKVYSVQVAHGGASCSCPDWAYRHRHGVDVCKHATPFKVYKRSVTH